MFPACDVDEGQSGSLMADLHADDVVDHGDGRICVVFVHVLADRLGEGSDWVWGRCHVLLPTHLHAQA